MDKYEVRIIDEECQRSDIPIYHSFEFIKLSELTGFIGSVLNHSTDKLVAEIRIKDEE